MRIIIINNKEALKMNKTEILETIEWALFSERVNEYDALLSGDKETSWLYDASAAGQIKIAHQLLGSRYYHQINKLAETVARKAFSESVNKRQQRRQAAL